MQPRVAKHLAHLDELIARLEQHIQLKLVEEINVGDPAAMAPHRRRDRRPATSRWPDIAERMERLGGGAADRPGVAAPRDAAARPS